MAADHYVPPAHGAGTSSAADPAPAFGTENADGPNVALDDALRRTASLEGDVILDLLREVGGWCDVRNQFT